VLGTVSNGCIVGRAVVKGQPDCVVGSGQAVNLAVILSKMGSVCLADKRVRITWREAIVRARLLSVNTMLQRHLRRPQGSVLRCEAVGPAFSIWMLHAIRLGGM
jgi:hypothetical protein